MVLVIAACFGCQNTDVSRSLGARCDLSVECDGKCLPPGANWPGGFCTVACDNNSGCQEDALCVEEAGGVCAFACAETANCAFLGPGYVCKQRDGKGGGTKVMVCRGD